MRKVRKRSDSTEIHVEDLPVPLPTTLSSDVAAEAARVMARAESMGLIELTEDHTLDVSLLNTAMEALARAGIGRQIVLMEDVAANPRGALELLNQSILASPHPQTEWRAVTNVLGSELTPQLVGVSPTSLKRYSAGERATPDDAANRLHFLAMVIADLLGSYNNFGVRRWFERPRRTLGDRSPASVLSSGWDPDSVEAQKVASLAANLTSLGAT